MQHIIPWLNSLPLEVMLAEEGSPKVLVMLAERAAELKGSTPLNDSRWAREEAAKEGSGLCAPAVALLGHLVNCFWNQNAELGESSVWWTREVRTNSYLLPAMHKEVIKVTQFKNQHSLMH